VSDHLPGRPGLIRQINRTLILDILQKHGTLSRADLAAHTGVSAPSISRLVADLVEAGLVQEIGAGRSSGGRRPILLAFNQSAAYILALDVRPHRVLGVMSDLAGEALLTDSMVPSRLGDTLPQEVLQFGRSLLERAKVTPDRLRGVGAAVPGIVGPDGVVSLAPVLRWYNVPFGQVLSELSPTVHVENDVNALLLGETWRGSTHGASHALAVIIGSGVGAALMVDHRLHRGRHQAAGEIGSWIASAEPPEGPAGSDSIPGLMGTAPVTSQGMFEETTAVTAWAYRWRGSGRADAGLSQAEEGALVAAFMAAVQRGDEAAAAVVRDMARRLAVVICNMTMLVNPEVVLLGGECLGARRVLLPTVQDVVNRYSPYPVPVIPAELGDMSMILGVVRGVLDSARSSVSFVS